MDRKLQYAVQFTELIRTPCRMTKSLIN